MLTLQNYVGDVQRKIFRSSLSSALLQMANLQIRAKLGLFFFCLLLSCGVRDIEVDERETPIGAATGVPSGSGAFAGHTLSQRSLTGCPLSPALPEVRCTPGFSRLARTSVNRLTFKSRTLSCASAVNAK